MGTDFEGLACLSGFQWPALAQQEPSSENAGSASSTVKSEEKVTVVPFLEKGYVIIEMESATAHVQFESSKGEIVKDIPNYKAASRIAISKMPKGNYTLRIQSERGEKTLKFNLK